MAIKPNRRTQGKLTDIALVCDSMDINVQITNSMARADWLSIPDRNGNPKVWRRRNYATSPFKVTSCTELAKQGIVCQLRKDMQNTSVQSGWGEIVATNGDTYRLLYCYEENIIKIISNGFFDKTASIFKKANQTDIFKIADSVNSYEDLEARNTNGKGLSWRDKWTLDNWKGTTFTFNQYISGLEHEMKQRPTPNSQATMEAFPGKTFKWHFERDNIVKV